MATPLFNIGGLASGLDTNSIVSQLLEIERIPITQVTARKTTYKQRNDAWSQISTRLSALSTKVKALDSAEDWGKFVTAKSSNESAVGVSVTGTAAATSVSFSVARLAAAHQMMSGSDDPAGSSDLASGSDLVGAGTFSITLGGEQHDVTTDSGTTLASLASQINALDIGVSASVIKIDTGRVKLALTSTSSGDESQFTVDNGLPTMGTFGVTQSGQDAQITIGSGPGAVTVERSSNTVDDLIAGVTLSLTDVTTSPVTVTVNSDVDGAMTAIREMVAELNSALSTIDSKTKTATEGGSGGGPLSVDSSARGLKLSLRSAISGVVAGLTGDYRTASSVGISLERTGSVKLDEAKLRTALEEDLAGVQALFARGASTTDSRVTVSRAASSTLDGSYAVALSQAAAAPTVIGDKYKDRNSASTFDITVDSITASITVPKKASIEEAVTAINDGLAAAGISTLRASVDGDAIRLRDLRYGSSAGFTVSGDPFGLSGSFTGQDVAGTIGGLAATGSGRSLSGTGDLDGLLLSITASPEQVATAGGNLDLGTVTVRSGLATKFVDYLDGVIGTGGLIDRATDRWDAQIKLADDRIEQLEERLERREVALRRQFTALETAMGRMSSLSAQLASALGSLSTG